MTLSYQPADLGSLPSYSALKAHYEKEGRSFQLPELFTKDSKRAERLSQAWKSEPSVNLHLDYSKNLISDDTLKLLFSLAREAKVENQRDAMFKGEHINITEDRAVWHVALRAPLLNCSDSKERSAYLNEMSTVLPDVQRELEKMKHVGDLIHSGKWRGYSGKRIKNIINIGIGGSDLGPKMVCTALQAFAVKSTEDNEPLSVHFVSNVDSYDLEVALAHCKPEETLFIIVSKTFTTMETMMNATSARQWFLSESKQGDAVLGQHFVAVSTNESAIRSFGIPVDDLHVFKFWDWVGGRYSLWSVVGLSVCLYVGYDHFSQLLAGAAAMDHHFKTTSLEKNLPVILALIGIWYNNFFNSETLAILPYEGALAHFSKYLQQADMESNGKSVTRNHRLVSWSTGPILWGEPGTNGQHAFYQLIHQGTKLIPVDFIGGLCPMTSSSLASVDQKKHHRVLLANMLAQSEALMNGTLYDREKETRLKMPEPQGNPGPLTKEQFLPVHKTFQGNKPSNTILYRGLTPATLGALIALYEHKIFVQGVLWNVNSFDQWGVELGKRLALNIVSELESGKMNPSFHHDGSTLSLLKMAMDS